MKTFVENEQGSIVRKRYDENTLAFKQSFDVGYAYPHAYGFIINTNKHQEDCIDCYIITNKALSSGDIIDCEPIVMIEMYENNEVDHKVLMHFPDEQIDDLPKICENIKEFIRTIFKKFDDVTVSFGNIVSQEDTKSFIRSQME